MSDGDGGKRLLNLVGIALVLLIVFGVVTIVMSASTGEGGKDLQPETDWKLTRINESYVRVIHAGGEPVRAKKLSVTAAGTRRYPEWSAAVLTKGDYGIVRAEKRSRIVLLYHPSEFERFSLAQWTR